MALTNQPYLPLYAGDWLSNNKLKLCSAQAHGIMVNVMLLMHKSKQYGVLLLGQKFKQTDKQINNFALHLAKLLPFTEKEIISGLSELIEENVLFIENDFLKCNRMIEDASLSLTRSKAGKNGGLTNKKSKLFAMAKVGANTEYEYENNNEDEFVLKGGLGDGWNQFPTEKDIQLELPEIKIGSVIELFKITKQTDVSKDDVLMFWAIFKSQNFTGKKIYQHKSDTYSHFINWCKTQNIEKNGKRNNKSIGKTIEYDRP